MTECDCKDCAGACSYKPGWFNPDEITPLAEALGLTEQQLFDQHLQVDWLEAAEGDIFVLSPAVVGGNVGGMMDADPRGRCHWFADGKCSIHTMGKPFECAAYIHDDTRESVSERHEEVGRAWTNHQDMVRQLLGHEPESEPFGFFNSLGFGGGW